MTQSTPEELRAAFPRASDEELGAIHELLKRYLSIAITVANNENRVDDGPLTESLAGGKVNAGQVDPSTLRKSG